MRRFTQNWQTSHLRMMSNNIRRRHTWFTDRATPRQFANLMLAGSQFLLKQDVMRAWPVLVKVDISPLCNLRCTYCIHADPASGRSHLLEEQSFRGNQRMALNQFARLVDEISGKSMAVSLYYLGDPLVHPDLARMCRLAAAARLNSHISTNFSFNLSDARLYELVTSGLTHLTVCVDAMHQESYERTRVGGRLQVVLNNLERVLAIRQDSGQRYPRVEVQYIKFQHNLSDIEDAAAWCRARGVDQFTDYWGNLHNYTDLQPGGYQVFGPKPDRRVPQCAWPHFALQVKYNGDVIPCCYYRHADQYRDGADGRVVGNVFDTSVWDVWNSPEYRRLRRLVANPEREAAKPEQASAFCQGCPTIFHTDSASHELLGSEHRWEDLYLRDGRRVVRLAAPASESRAAGREFPTA